MQIFTPAEYAAYEATKRSATPTRTRCTKYQLVTCLNAHFPELLTQLRTAYANSQELQFYWNTINDLDRNNADFQGFVSSLGITEEQVIAIFAKIEGEEPPALTESKTQEDN